MSICSFVQMFKKGSDGSRSMTELIDNIKNVETRDSHLRAFAYSPMYNMMDAIVYIPKGI